ncbi:hypothetical protein DL93DRAFT_2092357 [Clavulina sp. PMI_390]|nr:hypothetical protein DL93DRAFT_2092357 [Clavulina sp. PMI_390]
MAESGAGGATMPLHRNHPNLAKRHCVGPIAHAAANNFRTLSKYYGDHPLSYRYQLYSRL